jgi:sortase A
VSALVVALVAGAAAWIGDGHGGASGARRGALPGEVAPRRVGSAGSGAAPAGRATTTTVPVLELSQPENPPADEYAAVPVVPIGSIDIPAAGLSTTLYEGIWLTVLDVGPGHWPGTALPGGFGNTVIGGHRATWSRPFRHLDALVPGDEIVLTDSSGRYVYAVTGHEIVTPDRIDIVTQRPGRTVTLFACHPPGSEELRYVVFGDLVSAPRPV